MKNKIGILGMTVIAAVMFFSANNINSSSSDITLGNLINMNTANAQGPEANPKPTYTRWVGTTYPCYAYVNGVFKIIGVGVDCISFETEDPNLGYPSCESQSCQLL